MLTDAETNVIKIHSYLAIREFLYGLERRERRDPGEAVPDFDRAVRRNREEEMK